MPIEDPGPKYSFLTITDHKYKYQVYKSCRVKIFDAFWVSQPVSEEDKPNGILFPWQIPSELWEVLNEEEKLVSLSAENRHLHEKLRQTAFNLKSYLFAAIAILGPFAIGFFLK
jgi:hypothetical protein